MVSPCWRTRFEPLPDITTYELAMDVKHVNASQVLTSYCCDEMGSALRHRVLDDFHHPMNKQRMDVVWQAEKALAPIPHDRPDTSVVKDSLTTADTTQEKT